MYVFHRKNANAFKKAGVKMWVYSTKDDCKLGSVVYQEVEQGHFQEFVNYKSAFIYYIIAGAGKFIIKDKAYKVQAGDVVIIPPNTRFYYLGNMRQVLVTAPAWEENQEKILREINKPNK